MDTRTSLHPVRLFTGKDDEVHVGREMWYERLGGRHMAALTLCREAAGERLADGTVATCGKCIRLASCVAAVRQFG